MSVERALCVRPCVCSQHPPPRCAHACVTHPATSREGEQNTRRHQSVASAINRGTSTSSIGARLASIATAASIEKVYRAAPRHILHNTVHRCQLGRDWAGAKASGQAYKVVNAHSVVDVVHLVDGLRWTKARRLSARSERTAM